jgi:hypothetical protein
MDESLLIGGSDDESRDSACVRIGIDPASGDRIRRDGGCREEERKNPQTELQRRTSLAAFDFRLFCGCGSVRGLSV